MLKHIFHALLLAALTTFLSGCFSSSTSRGAVGIERQQFMMVSSSDMKKGASQAYKKVLEKAKKDGKLDRDKHLLSKIRIIANNLIPQTSIFRPDAPNWHWEVHLITSDQLNAWCMPGGKIAFYTGIIKKLKLTDGEIAAIMGHEISHALREHGRERASQATLTNLGMNVASMALGLGRSGSSLMKMAVDVTLTLPNSREHESEADKMGVELAARAGYNPREAINVWKKMSEMSKNQPIEILSTHPSPNSRIKELTHYSNIVMPLYEKAKKREP